MAAVILDETLELLDLLPRRAPYVLLSLGVHVHVWPPDAEEQCSDSTQKATTGEDDSEEDQLSPAADLLSLRLAEAEDTGEGVSAGMPRGRYCRGETGPLTCSLDR